ncbi:hypothetical protein B0T16DRAFT_171869 [Cercophora newfieldiana]|uniref:F-box domain-containing protein n=1 Tax=Cercophora newfieldiana TaxID=92897 RepID=A0AA39Y6M5_9PEZI|nr:hypothetical protein B0T16DRAFT_171869 [Cercophora newfieldiana]
MTWGSYYYCAICGGPFGGCNFQTGSERCSFQATEEDETVQDGFNRGYDQNIIQHVEVLWTEIMLILGLKRDETACIVGPAFLEHGSGSSGVELDADEDGRYRTLRSHGKFYTYINSNGFDYAWKPLFPFHWPCYKLLARALTETNSNVPVATTTNQIDKHVLFIVMERKINTASKCLNLDYGLAATSQDYCWRSIPGYELLVAPFDETPSTSTLLRTTCTISPDALHFPAVKGDLTAKVKSDPFQKLPNEIIGIILGFPIDIVSVLNLCRASWSVRCVLQDNDLFWKGRIRIDLPCFFELHQLMAEDPELLRGKNVKGLLLALHEMTRPMKGMTGPFMGLANRRRVWSVCEQIAALYWDVARES